MKIHMHKGIDINGMMLKHGHMSFKSTNTCISRYDGKFMLFDLIQLRY